jgi:hypothetical protein
MANPPMRFQQCATIYRAMERTAVQTSATDVEIGECILDGTPLPPVGRQRAQRVWIGKWTVLLMRELHLRTNTHPAMTHRRAELIAMGSIRQVQRGAGRHPSIYELRREPDLATFRRLYPATWKQTRAKKTYLHEHWVDAFITDELTKHPERWPAGRDQLLAALAALPTSTLRERFPVIPCLGHAGGPHVCGDPRYLGHAPPRPVGRSGPAQTQTSGQASTDL